MNWKPYSAPRKQPNINDMIYPKGEKGPGNVWVGGIVMNVQKDGGTPTPTPTPIPVPTVELVSSATSVASQSTYTFNSQSIGDGGGAICVAIISNGQGFRGLTTASIGGVTANNYSQNAPGIGGINPTVGLLWLTVTGTSTANISFTFNGGMDGCKIYTYRLKNLNSDVPLALGDAENSNQTTITIGNGSQPADSLGVMVGAVVDIAAPLPTLTFTNATVEHTYDSGYGTVGVVGTFDNTAAGTLTMSLNSNETTSMVALNLVYN